MAVQISRSHHMDKATARKMVEEIAASLREELNITYRWEGDRLTFKRTGVNGHIDVADGEVHVFVSKSPLLPVSEGWIRSQVEALMEQYLDQSS